MVTGTVYGVIVGILLLLLFRNRKPLPPTALILRRTGMTVTAVWVKSLSTNVVKQVLSYTWTGSEVVSHELGPDVESFVIQGVPSPTHLIVSVHAHSVNKVSPAVVAELDVPDLNIPEAPTNLTLTINE